MNQFIDNLNHSTFRILNEIQHLQALIKPEIPKQKLSNFESRQLAYKQQKEEKLRQMEQEIYAAQQVKSKPTINSNGNTKKLVNNYIQNQIKSPQGVLLQKQSKASQIGSDKINKTKQSAFDSYFETENDNPESIAIQCNKLNSIEQSISESMKAEDYYIKLQDRIDFIMKSKNEKIQQWKQMKEQQEEDYISTLTFQPQTSHNIKQSMTLEDAEQFQQNQVKWRQNADNWLAVQQARILAQSEDYSHQPQITKRKLPSTHERTTARVCRTQGSPTSNLQKSSRITSRSGRPQFHTDARAQQKLNKQKLELSTYI